MGNGVGGQGIWVWFPVREINSLFTESRPALGYTQPLLQRIPGVKRQERKAYHSSQYSTKVKNDWSCTSTPPYVFMAWHFSKHRKSKYKTKRNTTEVLT
jgi:hypothetical protein